MTRPVYHLVVLIAALSVGLLALVGPTPDTASAHPLGNFTINRYARLEVYGGALQVHYVVDLAEIPTFQLMPSIDADGDGTASPEELASYRRILAEQVASQMDVTIDGQAVELQSLSGDAQLLPGQGGLDILRVSMLYGAVVDATDIPVAVQFSDQNYADRLGWKEIVVRPGEGVDVAVDPALTRDASNELREYPEVSVSSAPAMSSVSFEWIPGAGAPAPATPRAASIEAPAGLTTDRFAALIDGGDSFGVLFVSLIAAFGFGALHALGPGHGKAVVAAYLIGSKGTARHAVALGLTVTATHTSMVYLLGFITIAASAFVVPERVYQYLALASGASVALMGAALFISRSGLWRRGAASGGEHRHGLFGQAHSHLPAGASVEEAHPSRHEHGDGHSHEHADDHPHEHAHPHPHPHGNDGDRVTWRSLITLGMLGGMLPCPSALVVMLAAVALNKAVYGMLLIVAFSVGLASVLTAIGIVLVTSRRLSANASILNGLRRPAIQRAAAAIPAMSALVITAAGAMITLQAMRQL